MQQLCIYVLFFVPQMANATSNSYHPLLAGGGSPFLLHWIATALALFLAAAASVWRHHNLHKMIANNHTHEEEQWFRRQSSHLTGLRTSLTTQTQVLMESAQKQAAITQKQVAFSNKQDAVLAKLASLKAMLQSLRPAPGEANCVA
jgi:hypothetical protein